MAPRAGPFSLYGRLPPVVSPVSRICTGWLLAKRPGTFDYCKTRREGLESRTLGSHTERLACIFTVIDLIKS